MSGAKITVAVCTHNRADLLNDCLAALVEQEMADEAVILVVANCCSDHTQAVAESFQKRADVRVVSEPTPGLSHARNRALRDASTEFIAYLDDDAIPEQGWLRAILDAFAETGADVVGGRIVPYWRGERPWWLRPQLNPLFSEIDLGPDTFLSNGFRPAGGNMAFRLSVLRSLGGFDARLGMVSAGGCDTTVYLGEETRLVHELAREGGRIAYCGRAAVRHLTDPRRCTLSGLRRRSQQLGRTLVAVQPTAFDPDELTREYLWSKACAAGCLLRFHLADALIFHLVAASRLAMVREVYATTRQTRSVVARYGSAVRELGRGLAGLAFRTIAGRPPAPPSGCL